MMSMIHNFLPNTPTHVTFGELHSMGSIEPEIRLDLSLVSATASSDLQATDFDLPKSF